MSVYFFENENPVKRFEISFDERTIEYIKFANNKGKFLTVSNDGTAHIWYFEEARWKYIVVDDQEAQ
jgi:hypothetical protein